jgi:hypothetical protein
MGFNVVLELKAYKLASFLVNINFLYYYYYCCCCYNNNKCRALAVKEYVNRHNNIAKILHHKLAMKRGLIETSIPYYKYTPHMILENERYKLYWDRTIITDTTTSNNRPDITLIGKIKKKTF